MTHFLLISALFGLTAGTVSAADLAKPLKVLLVAGGCCHDYAQQKEILKGGLEKRANLLVDIIYTPDSSTKPPLPILGKPDYASGYDLVLHDECASDIKDVATVEGVLKPHKDGIPGVNLHCAMHSYRVGDPAKPQRSGTPEALWFDYLGLQSSGHGPQEPIAITFERNDHPIAKGLANWTTMNEELYNNVQVLPTAHPIARGRQGKEEVIVAWTNLYGKTRVFSTTIGHNTQTVADERYLDLVTRGVLWACDKLQEDGQAKAGYSPREK